VRTAVEALYDAADDDTATGGPDLVRRIYPVVVSITADEGAVRRPDDEMEAVVRAVVAGRMEKPGG
jgi:proteasome beta subunit